MKNKNGDSYHVALLFFYLFLVLEIEDKLGMPLKLILINCIFGVVAFFSALPMNGQSLRNESWVSMGNAAHVIQGQGVVVQQSIGQSSVIGVFANSSVRISQGFLRGVRVIPTEIELPFEVVAFPNSFFDRITFRFTIEHQEATQTRIYDALGKLVYEATYQPKNKEIQLNLPYLAPGLYVAHLRSGNKFVQLRLIKKQ